MLMRIATFLSFVVLSAAVHAVELPDFSTLIEKNSPAVVKIETVGKAGGRAQMHPDMPEIFRHFFEQRRRPERRARSMGSGFIVSADGYILTNNHVIEGADKILVRLNDRDEYDAVVVGTDPSTDLALLKVEGKRLPVAAFGDSENLKVGEWVVAIGSPFGLDYSASVGIVSAIGRSLPTDQGENFVPFIQTDVAINPGNSGGPLFNLNGEVIGINSQIYTRSGGSNGISFAIPAHVAQQVIAQLKDKGSVDRGWFGISMQPLDKDLASSLGLKKPQGALVNAVEEGGPADKGGIEAGDVIVAIDGKKVRSIDDLSHIVGITAPGTEVSVDVIREGKKQRVDVAVGTRGESGAFGVSSTDGDRLGLSVESLSREAMAQLRVRGGVQVSSVAADSAAADAGIQPGDVIVQLGYVRIRSVDDYQGLLPQIPTGKPVAIRFFRDGRPIFRTFVIEE